MSMKSTIRMMAVMVAIMSGPDVMGMNRIKREGERDDRPHDNKGREPAQLPAVTRNYPPMPKGYKKYYFNINGGWNSVEDQFTVYRTIAPSNRKAIEKFDKWYAKGEPRPVTTIDYQ
jgi:hypothetical protein